MATLNIPRGSTLPTYKYARITNNLGDGVQVSAGDYTASTAWKLIPQGIAPVNTYPVTLSAPVSANVRGQDANPSYAATGGSLYLKPGVGSLGQVSGNVIVADSVGNSGWNGAHIVLGSYHLWVDSVGKLRVKNSAPISDFDGTVVGTQA